MTVILSLDSSSDACSVALIKNGVLTSLFELAAKSHTQRLLPMVDEILSATQTQLSDVDAIAFGRGPGSFTGLRICMGVVQGLAFGAELPVIPVSTLQAMAFGYQSQHSGNTQPIAVAVDARMQEVYWARYTADMELLAPEVVVKPSLLLEQPDFASSIAECVALGSGWSYPELQCLATGEKQVEVHASAAAIAQLAVKRWEAGDYLPIEQVEPVYLRDSVTWQKRERLRATPI